ncbi:MAG: isochorismate synthase [SAR324 cluster bacterium]|jgi:menaquinone-specific isochorismate synthase|nr:isochorismate synthase [SAR324 cluster bacterium]|tara:strand:- start:2956 stop:4371 length:1416 start_codon:yes stop_codon:yes gene_type:complete
MLASPQTLDSKAPSTLSKAIGEILEQLDLLGKGSHGKSLTGEGIIRLETKASVQNPLRWLHTQKNKKKYFWQGRGREETIAGIGECFVYENDHGSTIELMLQRIRRLLSNSSDDVRIFGGIRFNLSSDSISNEWKSWKQARFVIPEIELIRNRKETRLACNLNSLVLNKNRSLEGLRKRISELSEEDSKSVLESNFQYLKKHHKPEYENWCDNVNHALTEIQSGILKKIVLARKTEYQLQEAYDPLKFLLRLRDRAPNAYQYCFQFDKDQAWMGISPERLYRRQSRKIETEAVASTRPRGTNSEEDKNLALELLQSQKEVWEHDLVLERIESVLNQLCDKITRKSYREILKLRQVQHLQSRIEGHLNPDHGESTLINAIHPTPAVCGIPEEKARLNIEQLENFDRGWYAGPIGWISKNGAEFAVGIRSAQINHKTLRIYTGAGIVQGSDPDSEWNEIDAKLRNWESILEPA